MDATTTLDQLRSVPLPADWADNLFLLPETDMRDLHSHVLSNRAVSCLELGTGYGTTTCMLAAALDELGAGNVLTIDMVTREHVSVDVLVSHLGLGTFVTSVVHPLGYNWYLADLLDSDTAPSFDLCLLDGAHEWETDGLAFHLAARLLRPGGWLVLDDLNFHIRMMPQWRTTHPHLSDVELDTCQMDMVFRLLVEPHPDFINHRITHDGRIGWAQKKRASVLSRFSHLLRG